MHTHLLSVRSRFRDSLQASTLDIKNLEFDRMSTTIVMKKENVVCTYRFDAASLYNAVVSVVHTKA
jgi:hypothetical protein